MNLPSYTSYTPTDVVWATEIPTHWDMVRFSFFINFQEGPGIMANDFRDEGVPLLRIKNVQERIVNLEGCNFLDPDMVENHWAKYRCLAGDLLISCSASTGLVSEVSDSSEGTIAYTGLIRLWPQRDTIDKEYIRWLVSSELFFTQIAVLKTGSTIQHFGPEHLNKMFITLPPLDEQKQIADFLDYKTAQIDALIAKKKELIEKLKEQRSAVITQAVTKGLDPDAPMRDSGVEWLGQVPEHWEVKRLKWAVMLQRGHDLPAEERVDGDVPVVSSSGISAYHNRAIAKAPGIVTGRYGTIGVFHLIEQDYWPLNTTLYSNNLNGNCPRFLRALLENIAPLFLLNSVKSAVPGVDRNDLLSILVALPQPDEQSAIADYIDAQFLKTGKMIEKIEAAINRLTEYRTALITAATTGKIDVRGIRLNDSK